MMEYEKKILKNMEDIVANIMSVYRKDGFETSLHTEVMPEGYIEFSIQVEIDDERDYVVFTMSLDDSLLTNSTLKHMLNKHNLL